MLLTMILKALFIEQYRYFGLAKKGKFARNVAMKTTQTSIHANPGASIVANHPEL